MQGTIPDDWEETQMTGPKSLRQKHSSKGSKKSAHRMILKGNNSEELHSMLKEFGGKKKKSHSVR